MWSVLFRQLACSPVVNVSPGIDIPALNCRPHPVHHLVPGGLSDQPGLWPVKHDVGKDPAGVVRHFNPVRFAI